MKWINNSSGKPDAMLTFAFIAFCVVTINMILWSFSPYTIFGKIIIVKLFDQTVSTAYLAATFGSYVGRKYTDRRFKEVKKDSDE